MAFDPNLNHSGASNIMLNGEENGLEFPDWCQNEESFDLTTFMSSSRNLELCNDDLFENLFPPNSPPPAPKKESNEHYNDAELEGWYFAARNDPQSAGASACSSTATSPVPQNYYNTPPVTPRAERYRSNSPHHLQFEGLTTSISSLRNEKPSIASPAVRQALNGTLQNSVQPNITVKEEQYDSDMVGSSTFGFNNQETNTVITPRPLSNVNGTPYHLQKDTNIVFKTEDKAHSSKRPSTSSQHLNAKKSKSVEKGSVEYMEKRKRNNVAVRRSRDKAKMKAIETQKKVDELSNENAALRKRVSELTNELNTLKNLLTSIPQASNCLPKV